MKESVSQKHYKPIPAFQLFLKSLGLLVLVITLSCSENAPKNEQLIAVEDLIQKLDEVHRQVDAWSPAAIADREAQLNALLHRNDLQNNSSALDALRLALDFLPVLEENLPQLKSGIHFNLQQLNALQHAIENKEFSPEQAGLYLKDETQVTENLLMELDYYINRWNAHQLLIETLTTSLQI